MKGAENLLLFEYKVKLQTFIFYLLVTVESDVHAYIFTHTHTHLYVPKINAEPYLILKSPNCLLKSGRWDEKGRGGEREDRREWKGREEKEERRGEKEHHKSQWNRPCIRSKLCGENEEVSTKIPSRNNSSAPLPAATWERGPGFQSFQFLHRSQESSCTISYMLTQNS